MRYGTEVLARMFVQERRQQIANAYITERRAELASVEAQLATDAGRPTRADREATKAAARALAKDFAARLKAAAPAQARDYATVFPLEHGSLILFEGEKWLVEQLWWEAAFGGTRFEAQAGSYNHKKVPEAGVSSVQYDWNAEAWTFKKGAIVQIDETRVVTV